MPTTDPTGETRTRLSPAQRKLCDYVTELATDRKLAPGLVLDELIRGHAEASSPEQGFREFATRWGLSVKRLADLQELLGAPAQEPEPEQALRAAGWLADPVDPAEVEADAFMAASEPERRADRLAAGIVDSEVVSVEPAPLCDCDGSPHRLACPQRRIELIAAARTALDWLETHPDAPLYKAWFIETIQGDDDAQGEAEVRRIASKLGLTPTLNHHDIRVTVDFGGDVRWECYYIWRNVMRRHAAETSYHGSVQPDGGEPR